VHPSSLLGCAAPEASIRSRLVTAPLETVSTSTADGLAVGTTQTSAAPAATGAGPPPGATACQHPSQGSQCGSGATPSAERGAAARAGRMALARASRMPSLMMAFIRPPF
jgi:hypothetical protein